MRPSPLSYSEFGIFIPQPADEAMVRCDNEAGTWASALA